MNRAHPGNDPLALVREIVTDLHGRPYPVPERADYPAGIEGSIAWLRAWHAARDRRTNEANAAFDRAFHEGLK